MLRDWGVSIRLYASCNFLLLILSALLHVTLYVACKPLVYNYPFSLL